MTRVAGLAVGFSIAFLALGLLPVQANSEISISHTPPGDVVPGVQIPLIAVLRNATAALVSWRNGTMDADARAPMTNLSEPEGNGWVYAAWLPPQSAPTQVRYEINASNEAGYRAEAYFLRVDYPVAPGLTQSQQDAWVLSLVASLAMAVSVLATMYWHTGRRLRRGVD